MNIVVFDLETQNLFEDVGGRGNIGALKSFLRGNLVICPQRFLCLLGEGCSGADRRIEVGRAGDRVQYQRIRLRSIASICPQ